MSNRSYAQILIEELNRSLGLDWLKLDEQNRCSLNFEKKADVEIEYNPETNTLFLSSDLGTPESDDLAGLYARILAANLNGEEAAPVLALDEETGSLIQFSTLYLFTLDSFSRFEAILESFVNTAVQWKEIISRDDFMADPDENDAGPVNGQIGEDGLPEFYKLDDLA